MTDVPESRLRQLAHELADAAPAPLPWPAVVRRAEARADDGAPVVTTEAPARRAPGRTPRMPWRVAVAGVAVAGVAALAVVAVRDRGDRDPADGPAAETTATTPSSTTTAASALGWGELDGRTFDAIGFDGIEWTLNRTLTVEFSGTDTMVVTGACNAMAVTGHLRGDVLVVDDLVMTAQSCGTEVDAIDTTLAELLRSAPTFTLDGDDLVIAGEAGQVPVALTLRDRAALGAPAVGSELWALLDARAFDAISIDGLDWPDDRTLRIGFANDRVLVDGACNEIGAPATIEGDVLVAASIESTDVGCAPAIQQLDQTIRELLLARPTVALDADVLTLSATVAGNAVTIVLQDRLTAGVETPFEGTTWNLVSAIAVDVQYSDVADATVRVRFDAGMLSVATPCGALSGPYSYEPNAVASSGLLTVFTLPELPAACGDDRDVIELALSTLRSATDEQISGTRLRIQAQADSAIELEPVNPGVTPAAISVSVAAPPPLLDMRRFATLDIAEGSCGPTCVPPTAILDDGRVVVVDVDGGRLLVIETDGTVVELPLDADEIPTTVTGGPAGMLYGVAPAPTDTNAAGARYVAISTGGASAGDVVASAPTSMTAWVEQPAVMLGLGQDGVVDRRSGEVLLGYVDELGRPVAPEAVGERFTLLGDGTVLDAALVPRWRLDIVRDPGYEGPYVADPPPVPSSGRRVVVSTAIGPPADDSDYSPPTTPVIAILEADGGGTWWSLPEGWQLVASDVYGTVLARRTGDTVELASI